MPYKAIFLPELTEFLNLGVSALRIARLISLKKGSALKPTYLYKCTLGTDGRDSF